MIPPTFETPCGTVKLWRGDCLEVMQSWPDGAVDAVVTDPPYGIGEQITSGGKKKSQLAGWHLMTNSGANEWDVRPSKEVFDVIFEISRVQIIWGGNFFDIPVCEKPLCWDKVRPNQKNASEWEYAWTSLRGRAEMFRFCANGGFILHEPRVHPTQKPVPLMEWCIEFTSGELIADPFTGSGTTGVAAVKLGRKFWGIELDEGYFETAKNRILDAMGYETKSKDGSIQKRLFVPELKV